MPAGRVTIFGGRLHPGIELSIKGQLPVSDEEVARNIKASPVEKFYRRVPVSEAKPHRLAVVGGGPSINKHVETLRNWPGDIWAINGAFGWCRDHGIDAYLFACDPHPIVERWAQGAKKAILANTVQPSVFEMLKDADVTVFDADGRPDGIVGFGFTATCAPHLGFRMGYLAGITFFGCESCYNVGGSHAYMDEGRTEEMLLETADGDEFLTAPDYYLQANKLAEQIRDLPEYLSEESGGLLRALIANPKFHLRWVSEELGQNIKKLSAVRAALSNTDELLKNFE